MKATTTVVAALILYKLVETKIVYTLSDIQTHMLDDHGVRLTYMQAWRAKKRTLELVRGNPTESSGKLPSYFYMLEKTYPGSHVKLHKSEDGLFLYPFVELNASKKEWEFCRPTVVVDGSFLKDAYNGTILTASTLNAADFILGEKYHEILKLNKEEVNNLKVQKSFKYLHTVIDGTHFTVNLQERKCSCGRFQLDELPCPHALAIVYKKNIECKRYCSSYYTKQNLSQTYEFGIDNFSDSSTWDVPLHISA